jgi:GGDEF domain-containing protein
LSLSVTPGAQDSARAPLKATLGKSVAPLDPLTDLANRILVLDRAEQILARARRQDVPVNALFVDIDGFKRIQRPLRPKT